jgi:hypothetical protein
MEYGILNKDLASALALIAPTWKLSEHDRGLLLFRQYAIPNETLRLRVRVCAGVGACVRERVIANSVNNVSW